MKNQNFIFTAFFVLASSLSAFAAKSTPQTRRQYTSVPPHAERIYMIRESGLDKDYLKSQVLQEIADKEKKVDLELNCEAILYVWEGSSKLFCSDDQYGGCLNPLNYVFDPTNNYKSVNNMNVDAFCVKRSFEQKMLISLLRQCEASPSMECYQMKDTFKEILPLYRVNFKK